MRTLTPRLPAPEKNNNGALCSPKDNEREAWGLVTLLALTALGSYLCRTNVSVAGALLMRDLGFSQIGMGSLFSAFVLGYALFQIPAGSAADRWGTAPVLGIASLSWVVLTLIIASLGRSPFSAGTMSAFTLLLIFRFILGVAESPTFPAAARGVAHWIPARHQGSANGIVLGAVGVASAIAPAVLSRVMIHWGWRYALLISALPALATGFLWTALRGRRVQNNRPAQKSAFSLAGIRTLWSRNFVLLTLSYTIEGYVSYIFIFWFYLYLVDVRHFNLTDSGSLSSLPGIFSILSIPLGGVVSDKLSSGKMGLRWGRGIIGIMGLFFAGLFLILGAGTNNAKAAVVYLALATACVLSVEGPAWATMIEIAGTRSGMAGGVMNCGSNIGGAISPLLTPILAARIGWKNALYVAAVLSMIGAALWAGIVPNSSSRSSVHES
ncbi:MAG TPA: MFS transporter [Terriglobales bacterium]|jgi:ACS family glucarate transporter-like MFS transporter